MLSGEIQGQTWFVKKLMGETSRRMLATASYVIAKQKRMDTLVYSYDEIVRKRKLE